MKCKEVINILLSHRLEEEMSEELREHIEKCGRCGEQWRLIAEMERSGSNTLAETEMSELFIQRVHEMAVRELARRRTYVRKTSLLPLLASAAVFMLAAGLVVVWWLWRSEVSQPGVSVEVTSLDIHIDRMRSRVTWHLTDIKQKFVDIRPNEEKLDYRLENMKGRITRNLYLLEQELKHSVDENVQHPGHTVIYQNNNKQKI